MAFIVTNINDGIETEQVFEDDGKLIENKKSEVETKNQEEVDNNESETDVEYEEDNTDSSDTDVEVDTEYEADDEDTESEQDHDDEEETDEDLEEEKPRKNGFKKRVDKLTKRNSEKDDTIEVLKREIELLKSQNETILNINEDEIIEPDYNSFDTHEEYIKAYTEYTTKKEVVKQSKELIKRNQQNVIDKEAQRILGTLEDKIGKAKKEITDWEAATKGMQFSFGVEKQIMRHVEYADKIIYFLGKNRSELDRLNKLDYDSQVEELALIKNRFIKKSVNPATKKITNMPEPIKSIKAKTVNVSKKIEDMTQAEYEAYRLSKAK